MLLLSVFLCMYMVLKLFFLSVFVEHCDYDLLQGHVLFDHLLFKLVDFINLVFLYEFFYCHVASSYSHHEFPVDDLRMDLFSPK